jgi:hypothetical protein
MPPVCTIYDNVESNLGHDRAYIEERHRQFKELRFQDLLFTNVEVCNIKWKAPQFIFALVTYIDTVNNR